MTHSDYALCFKALSDETRLKIVEMLKGGTMCACRILEQFEITQPTLSYHMKMLVDSGLVAVEKIGIWNHYSTNNSLLIELADLLMKNEEKNENCKCDKRKM
ncbi:MAG: metalloregulator ArsR/SmtB family transcription factor [Clostridia bacterium]|nr:metalloregulator ArsR/SmtB family transcription factor [Clostridia bacterium]